MNIQEKKAFEAWLFKEYPDAKDFMIVYRPDENIYEHRPTQVRWEAWQAAKAQAVPEGFTLVPKKSTDWQRVNVRDMEPDIEDYENMSKMDWENLCGEIYDRMVEVGPE